MQTAAEVAALLIAGCVVLLQAAMLLLGVSGSIYLLCRHAGHYCEALREAPVCPSRSEAYVRIPINRFTQRWFRKALVVLLLPWVGCAFGIKQLQLDRLGRHRWVAILFTSMLPVFYIKVWEVFDLASTVGLSKQVPRQANGAGGGGGEANALLGAGDGTVTSEGEDTDELSRGVPDDPRKSVLGNLSEVLKANGGCRLVGEFFFGCCEIWDATSDGLVVAEGMLLEPKVRQRFTSAWETAVYPVGPMMASLGPAGALFATLAVATVTQLALLLYSARPEAPRGSQDSDRESPDFSAVVPSIAGAAALGSRLDKVSDKDGMAPFARMANLATRNFGENAVQLLLQTSLIAANDEDVLSQPLLAASVALGWLVLLVRLCVGIKTVVDLWLARRMDVIIGSLMAFQVIVLGVVLVYVAAKLYFIEECESHIWGLSTGCLSPEAPA